MFSVSEKIGSGLVYIYTFDPNSSLAQSANKLNRLNEGLNSDLTGFSIQQHNVVVGLYFGGAQNLARQNRANCNIGPDGKLETRCAFSTNYNEAIAL